jgi:hypothetical protein
MSASTHPWQKAMPIRARVQFHSMCHLSLEVSGVESLGVGWVAIGMGCNSCGCTHTTIAKGNNIIRARVNSLGCAQGHEISTLGFQLWF